VDEFIFYDDVSFIKGGYINRNNILTPNGTTRFSVPLISASSNKMINEIDCDSNVKKILRTIEQAYSKSPNFSSVFPLVEEVINSRDRNLAHMASLSVKVVANYLGFNTVFLNSSALNYDRSLSALGKVLDVCKDRKASIYINALGGRDLYQHSDFEEVGIDLSFIRMLPTEYCHGSREFVGNLSIIDVLMWNSISRVNEMLSSYELERRL